PKNQFEEVQNLHFSLYKNGVEVQHGHTENMLWSVDEIIAYCSTFFTLKKGDIIFTGTPSGVGQVASNDYLSGTLEGTELLSLKVR
ncbi:MAG: fumarylacetoacetate hydrolase family protein, partial [Robiginitalea sp.]|nr:fumarylacetoacetate hydrolase family protein [Robiginitalea sp.]